MVSTYIAACFKLFCATTLQTLVLDTADNMIELGTPQTFECPPTTISMVIQKK